MSRIAGFVVSFVMVAAVASAGTAPRAYTVLAPITHGNLSIFPVLAGESHDTHAFLTLDEGVRSGEVVVTEFGRVQPLVRGHERPPIRTGGAEVNRLVLVNNSDRPLLLLAGEIVTGGKQDRVIGKDRIIPAHSDPVDLGVFCVEPGRWTERSDKFGTLGVQMAQPSVRAKAMAAKDQQQVWAEVRRSTAGVAAAGPPPTTSYAQTMAAAPVQREVDRIAAPIARDYQSLLAELRRRNAVGVVAAVNGQIVWADVFASPSLLEKYWPKLVRSYAAQAVVEGVSANSTPSQSEAQAFLDQLSGQRQIVESEPGVFSHRETIGDGYEVFQLTSLLPKTGFDVHLAKMAE